MTEFFAMAASVQATLLVAFGVLRRFGSADPVLGMAMFRGLAVLLGQAGLVAAMVAVYLESVSPPRPDVAASLAVPTWIGIIAMVSALAGTYLHSVVGGAGEGEARER
jgi:hypothetical protein